MDKQNIIVQDLIKIKKFILSLKEGVLALMIFICRWIFSSLIAIIIIKVFQIEETKLLKGWFNITLIIITSIVYFTLYLYHKSYNLIPN